MSSVLLIGNYGCGNVGDELLRSSITQGLSGISVTVMSAQPTATEVPRLPCGVRSFFCTPWWRTLLAFRGCRVVVFGGGTLFTDGESLVACFLWWWHVVVAWLFRKPVLLVFQGVGPFRTVIGEWLARSAFAHATHISVRDSVSFERIRTWKKLCKPFLTADPAWLLQCDVQTRTATPYIVVIPRGNATVEFVERASHVRRSLPPQELRILSMQPDDAYEKSVCSALAVKLMGDVVPLYTVQALIDQLSGASCVVSQRYHGALMARSMGKACEEVSQFPNDKLSTLRTIDVAEERRRADDGMGALLLAIR